MTITATGTATQAARDYIRQAKAEGLALVEDGAVKVLGGTAALVRDGGLVYYADSGMTPTTKGDS